ncbi:MAG: polysaccharide biosynthesis C-terminal domain-containing protein [Oscillospiraceae bacterium]|nr:polysaccharide biosynthesis C-terminal domain-containing protein [Oscillospiraceae bacterium]
MKKRNNSVFYSAFFLSLSSMALQLIGFIYRIGIGRIGGAQVMGLYQLVMPAYSVISAFTMSGLTLAVSRLCAQYHAQNDPGGVRGVIRFAQTVFLLLFSAAALVVLRFPDFLAGKVLGEEKLRPALLMLLPCLFLTGFENIFKSAFHGIKYILPPIVSELTEQLVRTAAGLGLLYFLTPADPGNGTFLIVSGMVISEVFSVVILFCFYQKARKTLLRGRGHLPQKLLRKVASIAVPVSSAGLVNNLLSSATTVLIPNRLMAAGVPEETALTLFGTMVGMTLPLLMLPTAFLGPLNTVLLPRLTQYTTLRNTAQIRRKAGKAIQFTGLLQALSLSVLLPLGRPIAQLVYGQPGAGEHIPLLSAAAFLTFYHITTGGILNGIGLQKKSSASVVVTGISEILLTWLLVTPMGIAGYAVACIGSELIGTGMNFYWIRKAAALQFRIRNWFATPYLSGAAGALCAGICYDFLLSRIHPTAALFLSAAAAVTVYAASLSFLGLRPDRYLKNLFADKASGCYTE